MIVLFVAAGLAPAATAFGILLWLKMIHRDATAGSLTGGVALGLAAGAAFGILVGLLLIALVAVALRSAGR